MREAVQKTPWQAAPLLVGLVSLAATAVLVHATARLVTSQERGWFENLVASGTDAIEESMQADVTSAAAAVRLFSTEGEFDDAGFRLFVEYLREHRRPALQFVVWCLLVQPSEVEALTERMHRAQNGEFALHPVGDRGEFCPVLFASGNPEPPDIGLDQLTASVFQEGATRARESGNVAADVLGEDLLALVVPVHHFWKGATPPPESKRQLTGFAFVVYSLDELARRVPPSVEQSTLIHVKPRSDAAPVATQQLGAGILETPTFAAERSIRVADNQWRLEFRTTAAFADASDRVVVHIVLLAGLLVSLLLAFVTSVEARARVQAVETSVSLTESERELRRANEAKDRFLAVVSHELRNPLGAIASALQVMRLKGVADSSPAAHRALNTADRQVRHQTRLIDDLLDASRLTAGRVQLEKQHLDLNEIVARSAALVRPSIEEREQRLEVMPADEPVVIEGDALRLEQVFGNLLSNASKYTPSQGRIVVKVDADADSVSVSVEDEGMGVVANELEEIFEPFFQKREGQYPSEGLGLGLSIVSGLVALHGGRVRAESDGVGLGARFTVTLPRAHGTPSELQKPRLSPTPAAREETGSALVVDDMDDGREMLREFLELLGFDVSEAATGQAALESLEERMSGVVLLDIGLPDIDGVEVARRIRARPGCERVKIIAVTGYGAPQDRERAMRADFDAYVVKPVDFQELVRLLEPTQTNAQTNAQT